MKASGASLAETCESELFVPVALGGVRQCIAENRENYGDHRLDASSLRPSIETGLHALMPQRIVAHLHAVDALAWSCRPDGRERCAERLAGLAWMWIPYTRPGAALASRIRAELRTSRIIPDALVLANHGLVLCGPDVASIEFLLRDTLARLRLDPRASIIPSLPLNDIFPGHRRPARGQTRALGVDPTSFDIARSRWVMYPDHAVFLGPSASCFEDLDEARRAPRVKGGNCIVVKGAGTWLPSSASAAAEEMLDCYADVCARLPDAETAIALSDGDVAELLNWEAERYRRQRADARATVR